MYLGAARPEPRAGAIGHDPFSEEALGYIYTLPYHLNPERARARP
jgi:hypothetical protein